MRSQVLTTACVLLAVAGLGPAPAADLPPRPVAAPGAVPAAVTGPIDRVEVDRRAARVAYETALLGTKLWEASDYEGCFRLYQGCLIALLPMLDHRPDLVVLVRDRLDKAAPLDSIKGAFVLREAVDAIQKETAPSLVPHKPLWDRLGGEKAVRTIVHDAVAAAAADPKVDFTRGGKYKLDNDGMDRLERRIVEWVSQETGGPLKYTGKDMKTAHAGMMITNEQFFAFSKHVL